MSLKPSTSQMVTCGQMTVTSLAVPVQLLSRRLGGGVSLLSWTTHLRPVPVYVGPVAAPGVTPAQEFSLVCPSVCLQFARSLVESGYPKVCCVQGGAQRLRSLGLLANLGKDP